MNGTCKWCGKGITKKHGFWNIWRDDSQDPEYCGPSPNHAHKPE